MFSQVLVCSQVGTLYLPPPAYIPSLTYPLSHLSTTYLPTPQNGSQRAVRILLECILFEKNVIINSIRQDTADFHPMAATFRLIRICFNL